jgi:hypothetical protein
MAVLRFLLLAVVADSRDQPVGPRVTQ